LKPLSAVVLDAARHVRRSERVKKRAHLAGSGIATWQKPNGAVMLGMAGRAAMCAGRAASLFMAR